jgi:hypothetical protein
MIGLKQQVLSAVLVLAAGAAAVGLSDPASAVTANLVTNPGLESGTSSAPSCWQAAGYGTNAVTWSRVSPGHTGTYAYGATVSGYVSGDRKLLPALDGSACAAAVSPGGVYTVSEWYRSTAPLRFVAYTRSAAGTWTYLSSAPQPAPAGDSWQLATWTLPALPAGVNALSAGLALSANGSFTVDDLTVAAAAAPSAGTTTTSTTTTSTTTTSTSTTSTSSTSGAPALPAVADHFDYQDGTTIADWRSYASAPFPLAGGSSASNPSSTWELDTGWLKADHGWGWTGRPLDWGTVVGDSGDGSSGRYFFRLNTRRHDVLDQDVAWTYKSAAYGTGGYPAAAADAVDVWLRYQSQYNTYIIQFDRTNGGFVARRKVPAQAWTGPSNLVVNKGVYYTLLTDTLQPVFGAGQQFISWNGVSSALPAGERSKPGYPNLAHDGTGTGGTSYAFRATARTLPDRSVRLQLYRGGALVGSWTDRSDGIAADGRSLGTHLSAGYFSSVSGWQPAWGRPIVAAGAAGFRADDIQAWFDDFSLAER